MTTEVLSFHIYRTGFKFFQWAARRDNVMLVIVAIIDSDPFLAREEGVSVLNIHPKVRKKAKTSLLRWPSR